MSEEFEWSEENSRNFLQVLRAASHSRKFEQDSEKKIFKKAHWIDILVHNLRKEHSSKRTCLQES